jgi:hypothetical protein
MSETSWVQLAGKEWEADTLAQVCEESSRA